MGRQQYCVEASGMTESEALRSAIEDANDELGHQEGYSGAINSDDGGMKSKCLRKPKPAKRCNVTVTPQKGARKWETRYVILDWDERSHGSAPKQAAALKLAREIALKKDLHLMVVIEKRLVEGNSQVADVKPKNSTPGIYRFRGEAMN